MESHLNLAHRSHRKAEYYSRCHQFSEAIFHYNKAIQYLEHSIQTTSCDNIRSSLIVQRAHCLNQIDHLKRRLQSRLTNKLTNRKENLQTIRSNPDSSSSSSSLDHHHHHHNRQLLSKNTRDDLVMANRITSESDDIDLYNILKRQESLLEQLSFTLKSQSDQKSSPSSSLGSGRNSNSKIDGQTSPILIVNELQTMNEKMKFAFRNLMETMEKSKQETKALQKENHSLKKELNNFKNDEGKSTNAGNNRTSTISLFPELPPLETPKLLY
uniref:Uncharacterized protein LOC113798547 n=1 Tax=Dermatophagoides pteronyssinus TaxID=6956 RepID=A0A6P6YHA5_DERPT|nr:uncharacterized protein LOC113798547 [Dermatophagoides pteronyssinus]